MTIKIVTDSTCDLPESMTAKYGITVVPLYINFGERAYLDGVELSQEEFYQQLQNSNEFPTTAAPGLGQFRQEYERLAANGATEILSIHVSAGLSTTVNNAQLAAKEITDVPITVLDSKQLSLGIGFLAVRAAKAAAEGCSMAEIMTLLTAQIRRTHFFAVLDTLEFLRRSGRVHRLTAGLGTILQIKPLLKLQDGNITFEKVRTRKQAIKRLINLLADLIPLEQVAIVHSHALDRAEALRQQAQHLLPGDDVLTIDVSPIIGTHVGPGAAGFVCIQAEEKEMYL